MSILSRTATARNIRGEKILEYLNNNPLATDEVLAKEFNVSINAINIGKIFFITLTSIIALELFFSSMA